VRGDLEQPGHGHENFFPLSTGAAQSRYSDPHRAARAL